MKYKHVVITRPGGPEVLQMVEDELPDPKLGEVQVKVLATGVAFTDVMMREGVYPGVPKLPYSPGYDIVGVVEKLGAGVTQVQVGQQVAALTIVGGYSEYLCLPASEVVPVPAGLDPVEAVSLVLHYVTAYQMLHRIAKVKPGEKVLIHGAAGGVGTALLELGDLAGLQMYGTASQAKHGIVTRLGGTPIDYKTENVRDRLLQLTGDGVDVVFDALGGRSLLDSYRLLRHGGRLVSYGFLSAFRGRHPSQMAIASSFLYLGLLKLIPDGKQVSFYAIASCKQQHPDWFRADLTTLFQLLAEGKIRPIVAGRLPLAHAKFAHQLLDQSVTQGNLVLICHA